LEVDTFGTHIGIVCWSTLQEFGSMAKTFALFGRYIWVGIKEADLFNPQEDCVDCISFGVFEKQVVISTGG